MITVAVNFSGFTDYFLRTKFNAEAALFAPLLEYANLVVTGFYSFLSQGYSSTISSGLVSFPSLLASM